MSGREVRLYLKDGDKIIESSVHVAPDVYNSDTANVVIMHAEVQCDLGQWHEVSQSVLRVWGEAR